MPENYYYQQDQDQQLTPEVVHQESLGRYTAKTFAIMFLGLLATFAIAWFLSNTFTGFTVFWYAFHYIPHFEIVLLVAELAVVIGMSAMLKKMSPVAAAICFFVYAVLTGVTFAFFFLVFEFSSLALVFGFTALYFGGMALFGFFTNIDLSRLRYLLLGCLIALIVVNILMLFIPGLAVLDRVLCTVGVIIFLAYTAYDTQKIKAFYYGFQGDEAMLQKACILSALELYLDFINLFLYLLRLFGKRKN